MLLCVHLTAESFASVAQRTGVYGFTTVQLSPWTRVGSVIEHSITTRSRPGPQTMEEVSVIGNFGGTFTVNGIGTASSSRSDEYININTNEPLSFTAANFTTLYSGGSQASTAGSISYEMQLYAGTASSVGAALSGPVDGTDSGFNGGNIVLASGAIPSNGNVVLRLSRTLNLTQLAEGNTTYTATGQIVLSIN